MVPSPTHPSLERNKEVVVRQYGRRLSTGMLETMEVEGGV